MRTRAFPSLAVCLLLFLCLPVPAQTPLKEQSTVHQPVNEEKEPPAILEVGAAANWNTTGGTPMFAPSLAVEITPVENWLELELGVSPFYTHNSAEWDTDLLFKKPWTISRKAEFMVGVGPQWSHLTQNGKTENSIAGEARGISCSGQPANTVSAGLLNPATTTASPVATSNQSG